MTSSAYSKTPLAKKLGIKAGFTVKLVNIPPYYFGLFTDMPEIVTCNNITGKQKVDFIHFFTKGAEELNKLLPLLKKEIVQMVLSGFRGQRDRQE